MYKKTFILISLLIVSSLGIAQNPLFIPDTLSGETINLGFQEGVVEFYSGYNTFTYGYNQDYLGPTLFLDKGMNVTLNVTNYLPETTTLHWHGLHVSSENDGGPHTPIESGEIWSPSFTVMDNAATYWYHPHLHEHTEEQVTKGGAGFIIVRDEEEALLNLPRTYGTDDFPIVIQSRAFDSNKQFLSKTALDNTILTNGTLDAFLDAPAQLIRLRLLNGSTERVYNLGFEGNLNFDQIATDGGLLDAPVSLTRLPLAPGERAEIVLDLSKLKGQSIDLMSFASELPDGIYGASNPSAMGSGSIAGYSSNPLNGGDFTILQLNVVEKTSHPVVSIPHQLKTNIPYVESDVNDTRTLTFRSTQMGPTGMINGPFVINDRSYQLDYINIEIPLNNTEIWEITNMTGIAHPFHIHDVQFFILDIDGIAPQANMRGRKDVVLVPPMGGTVRFITKFEDFANEDVPFMYHCHMLSHEDAGMMGQFIVFDNTTSVSDLDGMAVSIHPNPTTNSITLTRLNPASVIKLYSNSGQLLEIRKTVNSDELFDMAAFASGIYYFNIISGEQSHTYKVIKK